MRLANRVFGVFLLASLAGCSGGSSSSENGGGEPVSLAKFRGQHPIRIATTCAMVTDIVAQVAGEHATVTGLIGEGKDPHLFTPTTNDVKRLIEADVVFYSGLMLEGRMQDTFTKVARQGKPVYAVTENLDQSYLREPPEFQGHWDPHVWMDVAAWSECVGFVAQSLSEFDPPHADDYRQNAEAYRAKLTELDAYVRKVIASIPKEQRVLVTAHDAFGYFARAYEIEVAAVQGITTESEAGLNDVNRLVDMIVERKLGAIFVESSVPEKNIRSIIEGAASRGWQVTIGGELYSDAMGPPGTYEGTYLGMLDHNATIIARALGGDAPEKGWQGLLGVR